MTDLKISVDDKPEDKNVSSNDIKEQLKAADEYEKIKAENDKLEAEIARGEQLKARLERGGKAYAGQQPLTPEEIAEKEAAEIRKQFR